MVIALHHYSQIIISQGLSSNPIYFIFSTQGGFAGVALFFFLSGYGLMESEQNKHLSVFEFIKRRFWKIYKAVLIVNTIEYLSVQIFHFCSMGNWATFEIWKIYGITSQDSVFWFIEKLFICYAAFCICIQFARYRKVLICISALIIPVALYLTGTPLYKWMSVPFFFVGALVSEEKELSGKVARSYLLWTLLIVVSIFGIYASKIISDMMPIHIIFNVMLICSLLWLCSFFDVSFKYKSLLGTISFPVYLVHKKIIAISLYLGHLVPVWLFVILVLYLGWILQKHLDIKLFRTPKQDCEAIKV